MKISEFNLRKTNHIETFRKTNSSRILREKTTGPNCIHFSLKNRKLEIVRDYYEYVIDGKNLSDLLCQGLWSNPKSTTYNPNFSFNYYWNGFIGTYGTSFFWTRVKLFSLLRKRYTNGEFKKLDFVKKHFSSLKPDTRNSTLQEIIDEFNKPMVPIYGCPCCGDAGSGHLKIKIEIKEDYVQWKFIDNDLVLNWTFDKAQYTRVLENHLQLFASLDSQFESVT